MQHFSRGSLAVAAIGIAIFMVGCSRGPMESSSEAEPGAANRPPQAAIDEVAEALAKLDPADRDAARRQVVCPVSDEKLGSMGAPIKFTVEGKSVFLCCEGCSEDFHKEPQKFLAKLKP